MRRLLLRLSVALAAFAVGCGVSLLSQSFRSLSCRTSEPLPYCEVARNADRYHNKNIRVRARLIFGSNAVYVFEHCDPVEALASSVVLGDEQSDAGGMSYVENLLVTGDKSHLRTAEAIIEGHFDGKATKGCWAPKFRINATRVELLSEITEYKPPQSETEGMRTKH